MKFHGKNRRLSSAPAAPPTNSNNDFMFGSVINEMESDNSDTSSNS